MKKDGQIVPYLVQGIIVVGALLLGFLLGGPWGLLIALCALAVLLLALGAFFMFYALGRKREVVVVADENQTKGQAVEAYRQWAEGKYEDLDRRFGLERVSIQNRSGMKLHGLFIPGAPGEKRAVILAHGYGGRATQLLELGNIYRTEHGLNVLLPEARAHGESGGRWIGMGWPERLDYLDWIAELSRRLGEGVQIGLHGISMGGATVMMVSGEPLPPTVRFAIEDCGYTSVKDEFVFQMRHIFRLPVYPLLAVASLFCRVLNGFWFGQVSALGQVERTSLPMVYIHGEEDDYVPYWMVFPLYEKSASPEKRLITVPGAGHGQAFVRDTKGLYRRAMAECVQRYFDH